MTESFQKLEKCTVKFIIYAQYFQLKMLPSEIQTHLTCDAVSQETVKIARKEIKKGKKFLL